MIKDSSVTQQETYQDLYSDHEQKKRTLLERLSGCNTQDGKLGHQSVH